MFASECKKEHGYDGHALFSPNRIIEEEEEEEQGENDHEEVEEERKKDSPRVCRSP